MDDKVRMSTETAEYKFVEPEVATPEGASSEPPSAQGVPEEKGKRFAFKLDPKNINWKRFLKPVLIVGAILLVYFIFSFSTSKKNRELEQNNLALQNSAALVQQSVVPPPVLPTSVETGIDNDQLKQFQNTIQQKLDGVTQQVARGDDRISSLTEAVNKEQQDMLNINQKIDQLTGAVQQLLSEVEKAKVPSSAKVKKKKEVVPVAYHIRAIVPGRVWLESADGKSVTLRVGDILAGYGEVRVISPAQGMVVMSNGSIIQYGVNDF